MPQNLPEAFGKYKIRREIGRGANAVVYEAFDTTLDRVVALKVLNQGIFADPVLVARLEREAKSAANLDHPHIVTIYEISELQGVHYIAMKYIAGRDLKTVLQTEGALPLERVVRIVEQIADALDHAHAQGLIHRDIKPSNIIIGANDFVTVTDFGLVKITESSAGLSSGAIIGTPAYIPPELWEGQEATAQSDIYALGIVVYEMLTGRVPFDAPTPAAVMKQHLTAPVPGVAVVDSNLPKAVQSVIERALAKQSGERYQSARDLSDELRGVTAPVVVPRPLPEKTKTIEPRPVRRSVLSVALTAGVVIVICVTLLGIFALSYGVGIYGQPISLVLTRVPTITATVMRTVSPFASPPSATSVHTVTPSLLPTAAFTTVAPTATALFVAPVSTITPRPELTWPRKYDFLANMPPGKMVRIGNGIFIDNMNEDQMYGIKTDEVPIQGPFAVAVNFTFKSQAKDQLESNPSLQIYGSTPSSGDPWWKNQRCIWITYVQGQLVLDIYDGTSDQSAKIIFLPVSNLNTTFFIAFSDPNGKQFSVFDANGKIVMQEVDLTQWGRTGLLNGLFPNHGVRGGFLLRTKTQMTINEFSLVAPIAK